MLRALFGSGKTKNVVAKIIMRALRKKGLNTKLNFEDFSVYRDGNELMVHMSGDMRMNEHELMDFLNDVLDG